MKTMFLAAALALTAGHLPVFAQSTSGDSVRVQPGHFCANNYCVRFSRDLSRVFVQGRKSYSVAELGLRNSPVISLETYREIFLRALAQPGLNDD